MNTSRSNDLQVAVLSWINAELRKEIERREERPRHAKRLTRMVGVLFVGLSGLSLALSRLPLL